MKCPKCGYENCDMIAKVKESGSDYSLCQGICGMAILGPLGLLCGWSNGKETSVEAYWVCKNCSYKFKA